MWIRKGKKYKRKANGLIVVPLVVTRDYILLAGCADLDQGYTANPFALSREVFERDYYRVPSERRM